MQKSEILLLDTCKLHEEATTIRARNSLTISKELAIPLASDNDSFFYFVENNKLKRLIINGASFNPNASSIGNYIKQNKDIEIFFLNNDYLWSTAGTYMKLHKTHHVEVISSVPEKITKFQGYGKYHFLNLNSLIAKPPCATIEKKYSLIYYGTWRKNRHSSMIKYFLEGGFHISSSKKNLRKFSQLGGYKAIWCDKLSWRDNRESLNFFKYSLYLEDDKSTKNYTHLANRFYESIFCNVVQFFDKSCENTIAQARLYDVPNHYFVDSYEELCEKVATTNFEQALQEQSAWATIALQERKQVLEQLSEILL